MLLLTLLTLQPALAASLTDLVGAAPKGCESVVEKYCDAVWAPERQGNFTLSEGAGRWNLRLGRTPNDITQARFTFLHAILDHFDDLPADIRNAMERTQFRRELDAYLHRKPPKELAPDDLARPEFLRGVLASLDEVMTLVSWIRTEKEHPGSVRLAADEISAELDRDTSRNLDLAWADLFVAVWKKHPDWQRVRETFELVRAEYKDWVKSNAAFPAELKKEFLHDLDTLRLVIPGENPGKANSKKWHECGIDLGNSFYAPTEHELTVCVGDFVGAPPLLSVAHEVGHAFSVSRRLLDYWKRSGYGQAVLELWGKACEAKHYGCDGWSAFKTRFAKEARGLAPYRYEDEKLLARFQDKKLDAVPTGAELTRLADRVAKNTVRSEVNSHYLESLVKAEEILPTGAKVPNFSYLKPCLNANNWPRPDAALDNPDLQFEMFFVEEYACQLEKKREPSDALRRSVEEASRLATLTWANILRVPGRFSYLQDARDEEFAQDVEEDAVDAGAATVVARILARKPHLGERRAEFLAALSGYCDRPSFLQRYPEEALVLSRFTNLPHSEGLDRRRKLLTPEVKTALQCR